MSATWKQKNRDGRVNGVRRGAKTKFESTESALNLRAFMSGKHMTKRSQHSRAAAAAKQKKAASDRIGFVTSLLMGWVAMAVALFGKVRQSL